MPVPYKFQDNDLGKVSVIMVGCEDGLDHFFNENWEEIGTQPSDFKGSMPGETTQIVVNAKKTPRAPVLQQA